MSTVLPAELILLAGADPTTISRAPLDRDQLAAQLVLLGGRWTHQGPDLARTVTLTGMTGAPPIAAAAVEIADALDHHPRIVLDYGKVELTIHTHDRDSITMLDVLFAARFEQWADQHHLG